MSDKLVYHKAEDSITPCLVSQTFGSCFVTNENGNHIYYTVFQGDPACFFAYDIDERRVLDQQPLVDENGNVAVRGGCAVDMGPDGIISILGGGKFYTYQPQEKKLKYHGKIGDQECNITKGDFDSAGNYYFGTYPSASLMKFDKQTEKLICVKKGVVPGNYARAVAVYQNKVFIGGLGAPYDVPFVKYDLATQQTTKIALPSYENNPSDGYRSVYSISRISETLICIRILGDRYLSMIFDMEQEAFIDIFEGINYIYCSELYQNKIYFIWNDRIASRDIVRKETKVYHSIFTKGMHCVAPTLVTLKDQEKYPGESLLIDSTCIGILIYNFETETQEYIENGFPSMPTEMRMIRKGPGDYIICCGMGGSWLYAYDCEKNTIRKTRGAQKEDICIIDGKCYLGGYGEGGTLMEWDLSLPDIPGENPKEISSMYGSSVKQDRVFAITDAGDYIAYGSVPYYGSVGGAIALYHKKERTTKTFCTVVQNQSVTGLAYRDGKLYGCTGIYGALGTQPADDHAKLFIFDIETETVELIRNIILTDQIEKQYVSGQLTWSPEGRLFAGTHNHLIEIDPETLEIKASLKLGSLPPKQLSEFRWQGSYFSWTASGELFTNVGYVLHLVDVVNWRAQKLWDDTCQSFSVAEDGSIYVQPVEGNHLYHLKQ